MLTKKIRNCPALDKFFKTGGFVLRYGREAQRRKAPAVVAFVSSAVGELANLGKTTNHRLSKGFLLGLALGAAATAIFVVLVSET